MQLATFDDLVEFSRARARGKGRGQGKVRVPRGGGKRRGGLPGATPIVRPGRRGSRYPTPPRQRNARRGPMAGNVWVGEAINKTVQTGDIAVSLTPGVEIVVVNNSALKHIYRNKEAFLTAIYAQVQGSSQKVIGAALGAGAALTVSGVALAAPIFSGIFGAAQLAGTPVAGWRIRLAASVTNNAYRVFEVNVGPIVGAAGLQTIPVPVLQLAIFTRTPAADIIVWSPQNGAGQFALAPGASNTTVLNGVTSAGNGISVNTIDANTFGDFESINARDLYPRFGACPVGGALRDEEEDEEEDMYDLEDEEYDVQTFYDQGTEAHNGTYRAFKALRDEA